MSAHAFFITVCATIVLFATCPLGWAQDEAPAQEDREYAPPKFEQMGRAEFDKWVAHISDEDFFAAVNLARPEMKSVRKAVEKKDYEAAFLAMKEQMAKRTWPIFSPRTEKGFFSTPAFRTTLAIALLAIGLMAGGMMGRKIWGECNIATTVSAVVGGLAGLGLCLLGLYLFCTPESKEELRPDRRQTADAMCERAAEYNVLDEAKSRDISRFSTLHFLYPLEEAYRITKEEKYAKGWQTIFNRWWDQRERIAGPMVGKANKDPLVHELDSSFRIQWLIRMWPKLKDSPSITARTYARWMKSILGMGRWMYLHQYRRWQAGGWSGNWAFTGCEGLFHAGLFLPEFSETDDWTRLAIRQIRFAMTEDFYADGGHSERSFQYDLISLAVCSKVLRIMNLNDLWTEMRTEYTKRMRVIYRWWMNVSGPAGLTPGVGDSGAVKLAYTLLHGAEVCDELEFLWPVRSQLWEAKIKEAKPPAHTSALMPSSKFAAMRNGWDDDSAYMLINYGEGSASHAHEDCLSFSIIANGRPLAMDPGVAPSYNHPTHKPWHYAARSHNMVIVDDDAPSEGDNEGILKLWAALPEVDIFQGEHRAFQREKGIVSERTIFFSRQRGSWFVVDRMSQAGGEHFYRWHINSPFALERQEDGTIVSAEAPGMVVKMAEPDKLAATIMGRKPSNVRHILEGPSHQNTFTVDFEKRGTGKQTVTFGALLAPFAEKAEHATVTALPSTGTARGFVVRFEDGSEEYYLVGGTEELETSFGPVKTDAQAVWLRMVDGQMKAAAVCKGSFLDFNGKRLISCASRPETIGVSVEGEKLLVQAEHVGYLTVRAPSAKTVSWNGKPVEFTRKDERVIVDEQGSVWAVISNNVLRDKSDKLTVKINNRTGRKIVGKFLVSVPDLGISYETSATVLTDGGFGFTVDVAVPLESAKMDCPISVVMVPERKWLYEGSVKVAPPLEADRTLIWKILPTRAGRDANQDKSTGEVLLEVENRSHSPLQGSIEVSLEGAEQATSTISMDGLGPFSKKVFAFPFEQSGSPKTVTGKLAIRADGHRIDKNLVIDIPVLKRFTAAPVIDADFSEWKGASVLHMERPEQIVYDIRSAERKRDTITARGFIGYDEKNLYFAFDVTDPHVLPNRPRGATPWEGTGIELYLDTRQERFLGRGIYNREVFQIYMMPGDGKEIEAHFGRRPFKPRDAEIASVLTDGGYRIEARMPWRNFPWITPERMSVLGFDVAINARSAGDPRDYQIMWHGTVENWRNAINFGRLYYESPVPEELIIDTPLAPFVDAPMTIDGDFADWDVLGTHGNRMAIDSREQVTSDRRVGEHKNAKIFAAAMTAWDNDNLYLAVDVTDPVVRPSPEEEGRPWEGSGIEVYIDARPPEKQGSKTYDERVLQLFLVPQGDDGKAYYKATRRENFRINMECKLTESGYRIEAAIPWKNFADLSIETTNQVGFDIAIDARGPEGGRSLQIMWHGTGKAWRDPSVFGVLRLGRKGKRPRGK